MSNWLKFLPIFLVYFIAGLDSLHSVTFTFLKQNYFTLTAADWSGLAIIAGLPWTIKILYSTFIDGYPIFGSHRKSYILLGAIFMVIGNLFKLDAVATHILPLSQYTLLALDAFLISSGVVIADIVADTLIIDIVEPGDNYDHRLGQAGVYGRLSLMGGAIVSSLLTGWLANTFEPATVIMIWFLCPGLLLTIVPWLPFKKAKLGKLDMNLLYSGVVYVACLIPFLILTTSQLPIFILTTIYILYLSRSFLPKIPEDVRKYFILACLAIFCFRVIPGPVEPVQWWMIGELGLDQSFFGNLRIISTFFGIGGLLIASRWITRSDIATTLIIFTILDLFLNIPTLMVYYKITLGLSAKTLLMMEAAASSPLGNLAMIPLHILLAKYAPVEQRAVYVATTAAFVNLALMAGSLITKGLNEVFIVTQKDFGQLGTLLLASLALSTLFSLIGIVLIWGRKE